MTHNPEALHILRQAGDEKDDALNLGETALALAAFEKAGIELAPYRQHLELLVEQVRAIGFSKQAEGQMDALRNVLVGQHKYKGDDDYEEDSRSNNFMELIDRKSGSPLALGVLYLHVARSLGWAMTGLDLCGHFLLRLSAQDGQIIVDPFRSGQTCQLEEASDILFEDEEDRTEEAELIERLAETSPLDLNSEVLKPLSTRALLLKLQHAVKKRLLGQERVDPAITTLQGMILFAPRSQDLWKELGYLQAERGHLRAAINALEVVKDLVADPVPQQQTDVVLRELRWRLN